jgi:hypothetical protein
MTVRRRRKDGFLAEYTLDQAYLQKPDIKLGRPGVYAGTSSDGTPVLVKEWARNSGARDEDLEPIWRHELRQLHRLAGYPGAADAIAHLHDAGFDSRGFYLILAPGQRQPLQTFLNIPGSDHWLKLPRIASNRSRIWSNFKRLALGLEALHGQGLLHRNLDGWAVLTSGGSETDFQLTGFEWSMRIASTERAARGASGAQGALPSDSFVRDWTLFGFLLGDLLGVKRERLVDASIAPSDIADYLTVDEARLLRGLVQMLPLSPLNGETVASRIDAVLRALAAEAASRRAKFHLAVRLGVGTVLAERIREASDNEIETDDIEAQRNFVVNDLIDSPLLLAVKPQGATSFRMVLRGRALHYRLQEYRAPNTTNSTWEFAYSEAVDTAPPPAALVGQQLLAPETLEVLLLREAHDKFPRLRGRLSSWEDVQRTFEQESAPPTPEQVTHRALELLQLLEAIHGAANVFAVQLHALPPRLMDETDEGNQWLCVTLRKDAEREALSNELGLKPPGERFPKLINNENSASETWLLTDGRSVGDRDASASEWQFQRVISMRGEPDRFLFAGPDSVVPLRDPVMFVASTGQDVQLRRRSKALAALKDHQELLRMIIDPRRRIVDSHDSLKEDEAFLHLDAPKRQALQQLTSTLPLFLVQGPPGVGKTRLVRDLVQRRFEDEPASRLLLTAQSNAAIDHLMDELEDRLLSASSEAPLIVRSSKKDTTEPPSKFDIQVQSRSLIQRLAKSKLAKEIPPRLQDLLSGLAAASTIGATEADAKSSIAGRGPEQALRVFEGLVARAANVVFATTNSGELERLIEERGQFDWAIVEEAAKATGSELISPLLLSHRRLMIGDHQQLPAFLSDQLKTLLSQPERVQRARRLGKEFVVRSLRDSGAEDMFDEDNEDKRLPALCSEALRLLTYFGSTIDTEFERQKLKKGGRPIAKKLTAQHRMHPVIADMVSRCFYGDLDTDPGCKEHFETARRPFESTDPARLPLAPIVVIDMPYVQANLGQQFGDRTPVWHNPSEVDAVVEALSILRATDTERPPTLAVLSPYGQQRKRLDSALRDEAGGKLQHLSEFRAPSHNGQRCFTVDSFQGSEADIVIVSLVRNNNHSSVQLAFGFLSDPRRMNVLLSRAKWQLILIASLDFLREVVSAPQGDLEAQKIKFMREMLDYLEKGEKNGLVARVPAHKLMKKGGTL